MSKAGRDRVRLSSFCLAIAVLLSLLQLSCGTGRLPPEKVAFGALAPNEIAGLIYVAQDRHLFARNGLQVMVEPYDTGVNVTDALVRGEIDIGLSAEYPFLNKALAGENISIIGVIDRVSYFYLFGRRDKGISSPYDLKGRRVGTAKGTITDFYLGRFLELNRLSIKDVTLFDIAPGQMADAIGSGSVDAVVAWGSFARQIRDQLGPQVEEWQVQSGQASYVVIGARNDWINSHQETVTRFLKSLVQAERLARDQPGIAKAIIEKEAHYDASSMERAWNENDYSVTLQQLLVLAMEDETRWMMSNGLTEVKVVPNYLDYIYAAGLKSVDPGAVTIPGE